MTDALNRSHIADFRVEVLNGREELRGDLRGLLSARVEENIDAENQHVGQLKIRAVDSGFPIDWIDDRVRIYKTVEDQEFLIGTLMTTWPTEYQRPTGVEVTIGLVGKVAVLERDKVDTAYSLAAGANVVDAVKALIASTGETAMAVTPSPKTLREGMVWPPATSRREIINDLLQSINYMSIHCDRQGRYIIAPWIAPADRPIAYEFREGETSIHLPTWQREADLSTVPNKFIAVSPGTDEEPALVGVATNENPNSPFSYQGRGNRWITERDTAVEAPDQTTIDAIAARRLQGFLSPTAALLVQHAFRPECLPHARVRFVSQGTDTTATIRRQVMTCGSTDLVEAEWREAIRI
ncbi:hypothetical protein EDD28_0077 [Salana multivorans]|uniref:Late control gene D protein (GPD) n=1 Tax=Salana multivorans TaxID=120377 RepID=A0A3N2D6W3_9MICO|nr:hypothetical protein [Salana multivorans]ROR95521.1 hypothetical protein EDD28_0077 [Salana multivorans]